MTIYRNVLIKKFKTKSADKNIFITAPGGYGKTVAARQWLDSIRGRVGWLAIKNGDNNPGRFYKRLAVEIMNLVKKGKKPPAAEFMLDELLEMFDCLPAKHSRCYLLIDDLHNLKNDDILNSLPLIVKRMPEYIRLVIASRSEPTESLLKTGLFETLTQDDLLFSLKEIEWLGEEKNIALTKEQTVNLLETTGGWAMYLSAILSGEPTHESNSCETPQDLLWYLKEKVWEPWDIEIKKLLIQLAVPIEITPELCERLTGQKDEHGGRGVLERLVQKENAFLSLTDDDTYRFHDIFRDFLLEHTALLGKDEIRRLNDVAAKWYFEQGQYIESVGYYIKNLDHDGIISCVSATNRFSREMPSAYVEFRINVMHQFIESLSAEVIAQNPYLLCIGSSAACLNGDIEKHSFYMNLMHEKMSEVITQYPDLAESFKIHFFCDLSISIREYRKWQKEELLSEKITGRCGSATMGIPFYHRSIRDHSEYYELREEDLKLTEETLGVVLGNDFKVIKQALIAGIHYERGNLLDAMRHALLGHMACDENMHPETLFCINIIVALILYVMGADNSADKIMAETDIFIREKARSLYPNFKAVQAWYALRAGNVDFAKEWLALYAGNAERPHLPFYQIGRHFATLRAYIALKDFPAAIALGKRLQTLTVDYKRPLDQIECGLLLAIALWHNGDKSKAVKQIEQALRIAEPYGFVQLFINEGREILPLLWKVQTSVKGGLKQFADEVIDKICEKYNLKPDPEKPPSLSPMRRKMLDYLNKEMSYNEIAKETGIAHATVKRHVHDLYKKLGVNSAEEAIIKAKMLELL